MEISDQEEQQQRRTPPRKLRQYGKQNDKKIRHQQVLAKYVAKEVEEIECCESVFTFFAPCPKYFMIKAWLCK